MITSELRIGNKLAYRGNVITIEGIQRMHVWSDYQVDNIHALRLSRIILTEEWLLKAGFKITADGDGIQEARFGENPITKDYMIILVNTGPNWFYRNGHFKLFYVHQLQNLYFALTGQELEFSHA
jgi:hypothetical protein